ncbi:MAG: hypothetical protein Q4E47_02560 [Candidatus Saccharibacteria bacterium]|nr:hypothetical protein [Candidatus Saccharibacteria bacterium]
MLNRVITIASLISAAIITLMLFFTTPTDLGPFGVFLFIMLVYVVMFGVACLAVKIFTGVVSRRKTMTKRDYATAGAVAFWPIMMLLTISLGTSNLILSTIIATLFVVVATWILNKLMD